MLLKFGLVILITVKRGPNIDEPDTLINDEEISPPQEDSNSACLTR